MGWFVENLAVIDEGNVNDGWGGKCEEKGVPYMLFADPQLVTRGDADSALSGCYDMIWWQDNKFNYEIINTMLYTCQYNNVVNNSNTYAYS